MERGLRIQALGPEELQGRLPLAGHLLGLGSSATNEAWLCFTALLLGLKTAHPSPEPAQPQAQQSEDKDKRQATCVHRSCTANFSWLQRTDTLAGSADPDSLGTEIFPLRP